MRKLLLVTLVLLSVRSAWSEPRPVLLATNGAWCWFGNPRAIFKNGVLHFGYVRPDGRVAMDAYDPHTGKSSELWRSDMVEADDHNNPGLLNLQDGRMLAIYAKHGSERQFYYRLAEQAVQGPATNWGPELVFPKTSATVTYANPYQLRSEGGRIYNFMRNLNFNPTYVTSDASGTNWSDPRILIQTGTGRSRPYVQYCSDYKTRIDFVYTDNHPLAAMNSMYHAYYTQGAIHRSDGTVLKKLTDGPLLHDQGERGSVIYQSSPDPSEDPDHHLQSGRAWCWDLACQRTGRTVAVFSVQRTNVMGPGWTGDRIYYYYARWTGTNWQKRFVAHAGRPLYEAERDYAGGITLDPSNPSVVYLSSNAAEPFKINDVERVELKPNARYELYRGVASGEGTGLTFKWQALTKDSPANNLRPYVPRFNSRACGVIWFAGEFETYRVFNTAIYGLFATNAPFAPFKMPAPGAP